MKKVLTLANGRKVTPQQMLSHLLTLHAQARLDPNRRRDLDIRIDLLKREYGLRG